ncbi:MAG: hypothetical protein ACLQDV_26140 [Candidatus Binataceae bacterium]
MGLIFGDTAKEQQVALEGQGITGSTPTASGTPISACRIRPTSTSIPTATPSPTPSPGPQAGDVFLAGGDTGGTLGGTTPIASGANSTSGAQIFNAYTSMFVAVGSLHTDREASAAVLLENNKVLIVGGERCFPATFGGTSGFECKALNTAELYDPTTEKFTVAGSGSCGTKSAARAGPTATLINHTSGATFLDGRVLIVGGTQGSSFLSATPPPPGSGAPTGQVAQNTAEIYDPVSDTFSPVAAVVPVPSVCGAHQNTSCGLVNHAAVLIGVSETELDPLDQGQVLIAGGDLVAPLVESTNLAFIFHPRTQTFTAAASMNTPRELFSLTPLSLPCCATGLGPQLAAGGVNAASNVCATAGDPLVTTNDTAEVYNPANNTWSPVSNSMDARRAAHSALPLQVGVLMGDSLIAGGIDFEAGTFPSTCVASTSLTQTTTASADLYNPAATTTGAFAATGSLNQARGGQGFGIIGLVTTPSNPGDVLTVGGECANGTAASYVIGTDLAASGYGANAQTDYSEIFDQTSQIWSPGPSAPASGVSPSNDPVASVLP